MISADLGLEVLNNFVFNSIKKKKLKIFEPHFRRNFIHINKILKPIKFFVIACTIVFD